MTFETVQQKARRERRCVQGIYAALAAGRIAGARKSNGKWLIPIPAPTQPAPCVDYKARAAGENEADR